MTWTVLTVLLLQLSALGLNLSAQYKEATKLSVKVMLNEKVFLVKYSAFLFIWKVPYKFCGDDM
jgi:hypothetical protein